MLALLAAPTGDIAAAEDALADAFERALATWPERGVPDNPEAWLLTAGRNRLRDLYRSAAYRSAAPLEPEGWGLDTPSPRGSGYSTSGMEAFDQRVPGLDQRGPGLDQRDGGHDRRACDPRRAARPAVRVRAPGDRRRRTHAADAADRPRARRAPHRRGVRGADERDGPAAGPGEAPHPRHPHPVRRARSRRAAPAASGGARGGVRRVRDRLGRRAEQRVAGVARRRGALPRGPAGRTAAGRAGGSGTRRARVPVTRARRRPYRRQRTVRPPRRAGPLALGHRPHQPTASSCSTPLHDSVARVASSSRRRSSRRTATARARVVPTTRPCCASTVPSSPWRPPSAPGSRWRPRRHGPTAPRQGWCSSTPSPTARILMRRGGSSRRGRCARTCTPSWAAATRRAPPTRRRSR
ncbi:hypothetical protein FE697_011715 [Mumia zhuanghuii]|uniref:RNA polymerase sigma-70 region 2 domain-containing protein n=1 Tax=Mumia zhuanghuii TaxID=2585211 RepID=A0A5Q6RYT3_9ACTN|nr:hypothetical protein FE697_011715 [Mumia zhuanghuii]